MSAMRSRLLSPRQRRSSRNDICFRHCCRSLVLLLAASTLANRNIGRVVAGRVVARRVVDDNIRANNVSNRHLRRLCRHIIRDTIRQCPTRSVASLFQSAAIRVIPSNVGAIGFGTAAALSLANNARAATATTATKAGVGPFEPAIRAFKFWRRVGPVVIHYKFTQIWFKMANVDAEVRSATWDKLHATHAPTSLDVILELRGLFVKIGQVMSSRADFVPRQYVDCFHTLQDAVPPWETDRVESIVRESLRTAQGIDMEDVFESFGEVLGSASIGQVHKAVLKPQYASINGYFGGRDVAVKVMHPDAEFRFRNDFKIFRALCKVALPGWDPILRELEMQMLTEFDYKNEAQNLAIIRANMAKSPYNGKVRIPEPVTDLCSETLLVMEYLSGKKLAVAIEERLASILEGDVALARRVLKAKQQALFESKDVGERSRKRHLFRELSNMVGEGNDDMSLIQKGKKAIQLMSMTRDARNKLSLLLDATGHQIFIDGVYNGDPHPGNILELDCGRLGLIDYGQTRTLTRKDRLAVSGVVAALGKSGATSKEIANAMRKFGFRSRDDNDEIISKNAALYFDSDSEGKAMGCATPQTYLQYLNSIDPMLEVPDAAVFVARTSFLFRGLGALLQQQLHTAKRWKKHANIALEMDNKDIVPYRLGLTAVTSE